MPSSITNILAVPDFDLVSKATVIGVALSTLLTELIFRFMLRSGDMFATQVLPIEICGKCSEPFSIGRTKDAKRCAPGSETLGKVTSASKSPLFTDKVFRDTIS